MDNSWVFDLETRIFSIVSVKVSRKLKEKYPNIFFTTTSNPKDIITKFPAVYIHEMPGSESGITKERDKIKDQYCKNNGIKLIRIPYWEFKNSEEIIKKELNIL